MKGYLQESAGRKTINLATASAARFYIKNRAISQPFYLGISTRSNRSAGEPNTTLCARKVTELIDIFLFFNMAVSSARNIVNLKEGHFERDNARIDKYTLADELPAQLAELNLRPCAMAQPSYSLCRVTPNDRDHVLKFLRRFFFRDEPMNLAVNLLETPESRCGELEEYAAATLEDLVSVAAVDEHGDFVGIVINGIARREEVDYTDKSEECPNPKFRRILKVLNHLDREARIWEKLPEDCDAVLEVRIASTHSDWRGRGLMRVLCEESERIAKAIGAGAMRMDTTSAFSAAAAERLNYKSVYGTLYSDLEFAPQPKAPHLEARVYIKELQ